MGAGIITGVGVAGSDVALFARLKGAAGQLVTRASIASIAYTVSDLTAGVVAGTGTFTPASTIFDSLQQGDARWTADSAAQLGADGLTGYNFAATIPASVFALTTLSPLPTGSTPAHTMQIDVTFTPTAGGQFKVSWRYTPLPAFG